MLTVAAGLRRQLRDARFSELEEIILGGDVSSPIEVAKRVKANEERDGWIPGPLQPGVLCALSDGEVRQLYATHALLTPSDELQLAVPQPLRAEIVSSADFRLLAAEQARRIQGQKAIVPICGRTVPPRATCPLTSSNFINASVLLRGYWRRMISGYAKYCSPVGWVAIIGALGKIYWKWPILSLPKLLLQSVWSGPTGRAARRTSFRGDGRDIC